MDKYTFEFIGVFEADDENDAFEQFESAINESIGEGTMLDWFTVRKLHS